MVALERRRLQTAVAAHRSVMAEYTIAVDAQNVANAAWAFGTAGVKEERLFIEIARKSLRQLGEFKAQEPANMA